MTVDEIQKYQADTDTNVADAAQKAIVARTEAIALENKQVAGTLDRAEALATQDDLITKYAERRFYEAELARLVAARDRGR